MWLRDVITMGFLPETPEWAVHPQNLDSTDQPQASWHWGLGGGSVPVKCGEWRSGQEARRDLWKEANPEEEEIPTRHPDNAVPPLEDE